MKSAQYNRDEYLRENRRLIRNLRARFGRQMGVDLSAPIYARTKFNELLQSTPRDLRELSDKELRTLNRDLNYISGLKTATKKGAEKAEKSFEPIREFLEPFSKDIKDKWWDIFQKQYEELGQQQAERFKYELLDINKKIFLSELSTDGIAERMAELLIKYSMDVEGNVTSEGLKIRAYEEFGITDDDI